MSPFRKKYNLIFFDTFSEAKASLEKIASLFPECEQVNVVIREEGNMDDKDILGLSPKVKLYAGKAWTTIHERRKEDGFYSSRKHSDEPLSAFDHIDWSKEWKG